MKRAAALLIAWATTLSGALLLGQPEVIVGAAPSFETRGLETGETSEEQQIVSKEREEPDALKTGNLQRRLWGNEWRQPERKRVKAGHDRFQL
jgi:hypothetical protein